MKKLTISLLLVLMTLVGIISTKNLPNLPQRVDEPENSPKRFRIRRHPKPEGEPEPEPRCTGTVKTVQGKKVCVTSDAILNNANSIVMVTMVMAIQKLMQVLE